MPGDPVDAAATPAPGDYAAAPQESMDHNGRIDGKVSGSIISKTVYTSDLKVTDADGKELGGMDVDMRFSAAYKLTSFLSGSTSPELDMAASHGTAYWMEKTADITSLVK